ncbi:MAG TPA: ornithine cyclodeaminase family protein [Methanoregulaceae archaeon]|nr:ornithine cyclodeaminase family protein [Methanoregulaceae archaeon]
MWYFSNPASGLDISEVNDAIEEAFAEHGRGNVQMPPKVYVHLDKGDFRTMPAYIPSLDIAGMKIVNVHPGNRQSGLPTVMALTIILDIDTGLPLAILNSTDLTDLRTGAAGAVAARYLAPASPATLGIVGSGRQAIAQVNAICHEIDVESVRVWSRDEKNAVSFCKNFSGIDCNPANLPRVCSADIIVTTTPSRKPLIKDEWVTEGTHINAIGADAPGKQELDPAILPRAEVFVDDPAQAVHSGEINVPISLGLFSPEQIKGTLGELVIGKKKRNARDEITIFDSTGLAIQDLAIAEIAMRKMGDIELKFP